MKYTFNTKDTCLEHIFDCGQTFRWLKEDSQGKTSEENDKCTECYTGVCGEYAAKISLTGDELMIEATGGDENFWHNYFDLGRDYSSLKESLVEKEPLIEGATESGYGIRILNQDFFEMLISFIISQNNNIPRIRKCIEAICTEYGEKIPGSDRYAFPKPEVLAEADVCRLAELKLGYRCSYIVESAKRYVELGKPDYNNVAEFGDFCESANLKKELLKYHGVGPKVADCIMLFGLGRIDAFPIDVWVKRIMNDMYGFELNDIKGMQKFAEEKFGEIGGIAQQYLFHYYRNVKKLDKDA